VLYTTAYSDVPKATTIAHFNIHHNSSNSSIFLWTYFANFIKSNERIIVDTIPNQNVIPIFSALNNLAVPDISLMVNAMIIPHVYL